ncbi:MAG: AmmeMemoRadiSam system protein B [Myxococcales bacterium]|nr:AmmeMemoRadiSam system protein B [Myxococcales bacterium]
MSRARPAAVAGLFYPADPATLAAEVDALLAAAPAGPPAKALIAPHAGYRYSGPIAARAYRRLAPVTRVVLLGPCHRVAVRGLAAPAWPAFATPLGDVPVDAEALARIAGLPGVHTFDATHAQEHALEVHLPFLQRALGAFSVVPLVVGEAPPAQVAAVIDALWGGPETAILVSSDLSHFLAYEAAQVADAATCAAIEALDAGPLDGYAACGHRPLAGLLATARRRGMAVETLDLRSSGDTAGDRQRVVGYGAWALHEAA